MFVSKIRSEGGADRSVFGDFWFESIGSRSMTGMRVSPDAAMRLSAVYACVRVLAETFAVLPFVLYKNKVGGGKEIITDHWLARLFQKRPNRYQNAFEWREMMQGHLALRGNAYNRIYANGRGEITELMPVHPDRIKPQMLDDGNYRYVIMDRNGKQEIVNRGDIWHIRGLSSDGIMGYNPIEIAREAVGMGLSAQEYGARFFANDARPTGGWIEMPGSFSNDGARKTFRESWQAAQGGMNRGKVPVLENGLKYHEVGMNNKDSQFLEVRQFQVGEIARLFRVPPHLIGDLSRSTNNNIEQQSLEFEKFTMTPWCERWEAAIETELLFDDSGLEVEFDSAGLMRGDSKSRAEYYASGIVNGWLTRNEARLAENKDPIEGLDEPLQPMNMSEAGAVPADTGATPPVPAPQQEETGDADARLVSLASAAAERIARKETQEVQAFYKEGNSAAGTRQVVADWYANKHAKFVSQVLAVPLATALAYCESRIEVLKADMVEVDLFTASATLALTKIALKGTAENR